MEQQIVMLLVLHVLPLTSNVCSLMASLTNALAGLLFETPEARPQQELAASDSSTGLRPETQPRRELAVIDSTCAGCGPPGGQLRASQARARGHHPKDVSI